MSKTIVVTGSAGRTYQSIPAKVLERLGFIVVEDTYGGLEQLPELRAIIDELHELEAPPKGRGYPRASGGPSGVAKARRAAVKRRRRSCGKKR